MLQRESSYLQISVGTCVMAVVVRWLQDLAALAGEGPRSGRAGRKVVLLRARSTTLCVVAERLLVDMSDLPVKKVEKIKSAWKTSSSSTLNDVRRASEAVNMMNTENKFRNMAPKDKQTMERFIIIYIENVKHLRTTNCMRAFLTWRANIRSLSDLHPATSVLTPMTLPLTPPLYTDPLHHTVRTG